MSIANDYNLRKLVRMKSGLVYLGNMQFLPGYCILVADPEVPSLNDLEMPQRAEFLLDMSLLGDAITAVCQPTRINYGILGNSAPVLHAHLFPRYDWEPEEQKKWNVWRYPEEYWTDEKYAFNQTRDTALMQKLVTTLEALMQQHYTSK